MKFSAAILALATSVAAMPSIIPGTIAPTAGHDVKFSVPSDMTVQQAQAMCGNQAKLSCCNKAVYASGDSTLTNSGLLSGVLSGLVGQGSGAQGLGLFGQCSQIDLPVNVLQIAQLTDLVNKKCQQNIACCQNSPSTATGNLVGVALPCVALGSLV